VKAFTFSLDRVLRWRITSLKTEQVRLEQIRFSLEQARTETGDLEKSFSNAGKSTSGNGLLTGADLHALDSYTARLVREIALVQLRMASISEAIAKQMLVVSDCDRNVRLLERLRVRRQAEWQTEMSRETDTQSGEFSASQWLRTKRDTGEPGEPD
jgi:flagellar export protein FliJ